MKENEEEKRREKERIGLMGIRKVPRMISWFAVPQLCRALEI